HGLVALVIVQHELVTARELGAWERDARSRRIADHFGVRRGDRRIVEVDDQPSLAEARSAHADAERAAGRARCAVASNQIAAADAKLFAGVPDAQRDAVSVLGKAEELVLEGGG